MFRPRRLPFPLLAFFAVCVALPARADVVPPLVARIEVIKELPEGGFEARVSVLVPRTGNNTEAMLKVTLTPGGIAQLSGRTEWVLESVEPGKEQEFRFLVKLKGYGDGSVTVQAESFNEKGRRLWGRAESLFVLNTPEDRLRGKSSIFELKREKLNRDVSVGKLNRLEHEEELENLMQGRELRFEREMRGGDLKKKERRALRVLAVVPSAVVSGRATYTQRTGRAGAPVADVFAAPANALPIRSATVEFFDQNGPTLTKLTTTPALVQTNSTGNYSATVPGQRGDSTAVNLIVKLLAVNPAAKVGPLGQRILVHSKDSAPMVIDAAAKTVNFLVDSTDLLRLRVFSIQDGMLTAFNFVKSNNLATGVGANPVQIFVEFPGTSATGSFFSSSPDDHLNIGQGHAFDWDVYTHEYGHYIQKINNTTQNPGGCHFVASNMTGFNQNQAGCNGPVRVLNKQQGIRLAWAEGWPTFFGTNLQIASGAGSLGIFGVADTRYTDTANNFSYDLEGNADSFPGAGEDEEVSVQRILWDFADQPQDGHDELTYGTDEMWRQLAGDPAVVTLDAFRAKFDGRIPGSAAGYSTGTAEQNRAKQGRIYFDLNVGPEPTAPADNTDITSGTPPTFKWKTKGANLAPAPGPSYHFNKFNVLFFTENYSRLIFTSPEISTAANATTAEWTPTAPEWATITAADPSTLTNLIKWVVQGKNDTLMPTTGPYRGIDRTLGVLDIAFVIDDTGSMTDEIGGVKNGLSAYISIIRALSVTPLIELITFKDNVTTRIITRDLNALQAAVNALVASGGGDCPESSAEALLEASKDLGSGKAIVFATDASPHSGFDLNGIKQQIRNRGITLIELVTGDCAPSGSVVALGAISPAGSANRDPDYTSRPLLPPEPDVYFDVTCPTCPPDSSVGPALSPNALRLVGDFRFPARSAIVAFQDIAGSSPGSKFLFFPRVKSPERDALPYTNAITNTALSASVPTVISVNPTDLYAGATMDVVVLAGKTNFQSSSVASFSGSGITINSQAVLSPSSLRLNITIASGAATGFRNVTVTTPLGGGIIETAGGTGQARVVANPGTSRIVSIQPTEIARGTTVDLFIAGLNTTFAGPATVTFFGSGITVNSATVLSPTYVRANVTVSPTASLGFRTVIATSGGSTVNISQVLSVVAVFAATEPIPTITTVSPTSGARGTSPTLTVTGSNTHFVNGDTVASFSGTGITVVSTTVTSPTAASILINITAGATLGFRDVIMTTAGETASLVGGFQVLDLGAPVPSSLNTVTPCRVADTRLAVGPFGGPALTAGIERVFTIAGRCGIPPTARAVSFNFTITGSTAPGHLTIYPGGTPIPNVSTLNYRPGQTRANNAIIPLGSGGTLAVTAAGGTHLIIDVTAYYQ